MTTKEFIVDMEEGGYAPDANNAIKRLNAVTRKWEHICQAPPNCRCIWCLDSGRADELGWVEL